MARTVGIAALALAVAGCNAGTDVSRTRGEILADQQSWVESLAHYRTLLRQDPDNAEYREGYFATIERLEGTVIGDARRLAEHGDLPAAEGRIGQALLLVPESMLLRDELERLGEMRAARSFYQDAVVAARMGRRDRGLQLVEEALSRDPDFHAALSLLETLHASEASGETLSPIRLATGAPVTMSFRDAAFKDAALALGRAYGVNMIFDADLADRAISVHAEGVSFTQAFELLLRSNGAFYRRLGANSVVIAQDTAEKRAEYEDYVVRTFFIRSGAAQVIADTLTRTLGLQQVSVDEAENTITVRDSAERVLLADQLINANDRRAAEMLMEVEVLEVNRTKSEQLGLDFGSQVTVRPPRGLQLRDIAPLGSIGDGLATGAVVLPASSLLYFKQDVDARTLASPRIRAVNGQPAQFHVGDRVPLRASQILEDTGQVRTTFEYTDVGIRLNVVPQVRLNNSVAIDLALEVSSLGRNLGTAEDPAYVIGTRNVQTRMELQDGETAIIGGLIRDEDRRTVTAIPGIGRIPGVGRVFQQRGGEGTRTDILLTLTPRIVRAARAALGRGNGDVLRHGDAGDDAQPQRLPGRPHASRAAHHSARPRRRAAPRGRADPVARARRDAGRRRRAGRGRRHPHAGVPEGVLRRAGGRGVRRGAHRPRASPPRTAGTGRDPLPPRGGGGAGGSCPRSTCPCASTTRPARSPWISPPRWAARPRGRSPRSAFEPTRLGFPTSFSARPPTTRAAAGSRRRSS